MIHTMEQTDNLETIYKKKDSRSEKFQSGIFFIFGIIFLYNDNLNAISYNRNVLNTNILQFK